MKKTHHDILLELVKWSPQPSGLIASAVGKKSVAGQLSALEHEGFVSARRTFGKNLERPIKVEWSVTPAGKKRSELPADLPPPPWGVLSVSEENVLLALEGGRPIYKRTRRPACLERPVQVLMSHSAFKRMFRLGLLRKLEGDLDYTTSPPTGTYGRYVISKLGRDACESVRSRDGRAPIKRIDNPIAGTFE